MIIKNLTIHNIASLAEAEIDFQNSTIGEASIFLISGGTGAGKSTILDAICLALYAQTPRMMSSSREELAFFNEQKGKFYTNDNAQLLRRGTGEGFVRLIFEGNDGYDYEAIWAVQRDHKKAHKKLQKPTRILRSVSNGNYCETHKKQIEEKIPQLTGLDYDQFCRTVMLPQGEFTKFLKSSRSEKSQILEKLTGTEIYSIIGKEIASRYLKEKNLWDSIQKEIDSIFILQEEEVAGVGNELESLGEEGKKSSEIKKSISEKITWIEEYTSLITKEIELQKDINIFKETSESKQFKENVKLIEEYNKTIVPRSLLADLNTQKENLKRHEELRNKIEETISESQKNEELKKVEVERIISIIENLNNRLEKFDADDINKKIVKLNETKNLLIGYGANLENFNRSRGLELELKREVADLNDRIKSHEVISQTSMGKKPNAVTRNEKAIREFDKIFVSTSNAAKKLRGMLNEGDMCPVCGQKVIHHLEEDFFKELLAPLEKEKRDSEENLRTIETTINSEKKIISELETECRKATTKLVEVYKSTKGFRDLIINQEEQLKAIGLVELDNAEKIDDRISVIDKEIGETLLLQKQYQQISKEIKHQRIKETGLNKEYASLKEKTLKEKEALSVWKASLSEKKARITQIEDSLHQFLTEHSDVSMEKLKELIEIKKEYVDLISEEVKKMEETFHNKLGASELVRRNKQELEKSRPLLEEDDNVRELQKQLKTVENRINEINISTGRLKEKLDLNKRNNEIRKKKEQEGESVRIRKEKWERLYKFLGDGDGVKFRSIAQSYILKSLLNNANVYMQTFNDRYTLTCNPGSLAILVRDNLQPGEPQPASILSGGEGFMASLSLALALSNLKDHSLGVDILFIDEGFGTLSPEYLENVMETLEKLHRFGGKKVGLISHVPELKDRIPVQINVKRVSPSLSNIEINQ